MLSFNLEYYRAFYFTAQFESVTKAADALYLSQPSVTHSIQMLEKQIGLKLFNRTSKGMRLTNEGNILFKYVKKAFDELSSGEKELKRMGTLNIGSVNIAATETPLYYFLLPKLELFKSLYPNITINLSGSSTAESLELLRTDNVELALAVSPVNETDNLVIKEVQAVLRHSKKC